ncbi:methyltransferase domain-containing protein [Candidatus Fermentibacteria bacterium]|nr:methyltransferase domain-containing protein [Candidatus Fermentibacteria bacterium]
MAHGKELDTGDDLQNAEGPSPITARLRAIRARAKASDERMDMVMQAVDEAKSQLEDQLIRTQRDLDDRVATAETRSQELETKLLEIQSGATGLHTHVAGSVESMKEWLQQKMGELDQELSGRLESMERGEQEVEGRLKRFEDVGERLKAMISATETMGPGLKELLGAVDGMKEDIGASIETMATVREDLHGSIDALTQAQVDLARRLAEIETVQTQGQADLSRRLASHDAALTQTQGAIDAATTQVRAALDEALAVFDRRAAEVRELTVLSPSDFPYFRFEDLHRGSADAVRDLIRPFVRHFVRCQRVADLGCGRGEFLDLCTQEGIGAYGVDSNEDMVLHCQRIGLDVKCEDIVEHLSGLSAKCIDGVFCSQVVEHLPMQKVQTLLRECYRALKVGTHMVVVTINPLSLFALANNFFLDPTHVRPLPPETMRFLAEDAGFRKLTVSYFSPFGPDYSLVPVRFDPESDEQRAIRVNFDRLNHVVFGYQEYALIGLK